MATRGIPLDAVEPQFPAALAEAERVLLGERREACNREPAPPEGDGQIPAGAPILGLALSGGGIRSATFGLGVLQGLARLGLLRRVDYLSTVSGGGYIGGFLGGLFCPRGDGAAPLRSAEVQAGLTPGAAADHPVQRSIHWLRENGRYLTPGGSGDAILAAATVLRNWVSVMALAGLALFTLFLLADLVSSPLRRLFDLHAYDLGRQGKVLLSYWFLVAAGLFATAGVGCGWAYWLVKQPANAGPRLRIQAPAGWVLLLSGLALAAAAAPVLLGRIPQALGLWLTLLLGGGLGLIAWLIFFLGVAGASPAEGRRRMSRALRLVFIAVLVLVAFGLLDSLTWTLYAKSCGFDEAHRWFPDDHWPLETWPRISRALFGKEGIGLALLSLLALYREKLERAMGAASAGKAFWTSLRWLLRGVLVTAALLIGLLIAATIGSLAHSASTLAPALFSQVEPGWVWLPALDPVKAWAWLGLSLVACLAVARTPALLNLTTLESFYTAALTRAYLGASNQARRDGDAGADRRPADDLDLAQYQPWRRGGPLHLVNTTLNVTTGGGGQVLQRDRKGSVLAVGPAGLSVDVRDHALWSESNGLVGLDPRHGQVFSVQPATPERLSLGQWIGISGAAVSTGMGARTQLAVSLLCGFLNLRLGHWWWSGQPRPWGRPGFLRRMFESLAPVQFHLAEEWLARFPGTASKFWYLSDGGHFENTGAYELLRRRLPLILLSDNGQDPSSRLGDLANLVAKARIDLGAEIEFLGPADLDRLLGPAGDQREAFGTLDDLLHPDHQACAALAEISYGGSSTKGYLIVLKPTLVPDLPMDLRDYATSNPGFPQQSTGDQFFDERQWESYRKLGEFIALKALGDAQRRVIPWLREQLRPAASPGRS